MAMLHSNTHSSSTVRIYMGTAWTLCRIQSTITLYTIEWSSLDDILAVRLLSKLRRNYIRRLNVAYIDIIVIYSWALWSEGRSAAGWWVCLAADCKSKPRKSIRSGSAANCAAPPRRLLLMLVSTPLRTVNRCCSSLAVSDGVWMSGPLTFKPIRRTPRLYTLYSSSPVRNLRRNKIPYYNVSRLSGIVCRVNA